MNKEKLIKLLRTSQITNEDIKILKNSPLLFNYLINFKNKKISKRDSISDNKKIFIILDEKLYCMDVKLDDDNISYSSLDGLYVITPEMFGCSKDSLEVNFCASGINIVGDVIRLETFKAEQTHDGIIVNTLSNEFIMNANDMVDEYDLPRKKYTYYKDLDEYKSKKIN